MLGDPHRGRNAFRWATEPFRCNWKKMNLRGRILWIDGIAALLSGGLLLLAADGLAEWYNIFRETLSFIALVNLAYGTYSISIAMLNKRPLVLIVMLVIANLLWSINCLRLACLFRDTASFFGLTHLVGEAIFVGGLAILEWRYRKLLQVGIPLRSTKPLGIQ
jgi:hypothetical protein